MKNKKLIHLLMILVLVVLSVAVYFITRPQQQEEILPQKFAQLPEKPKLIAEFHHGPRIFSVAFSPTDSSLVAAINDDGTIKLWNLNDSKEEKVLSHPGIFAYISFAPTGELLASEGQGKLVLWDVASGTKINTIEHSSRDFDFSPDGHQLATLYNEVKIWNVQNPMQITEVSTLPFEEIHRIRSWACAVSISRDGNMIAAGYASGLVNVWNLQTKQHIKTLRTPYVEMRYLKFSPDSKFLVCGGPVPMRHIYLGKHEHDSLGVVSDGAQGYIMWKIPSWERHAEVQRGNVDKLIFSPDGKLCASMNDKPFRDRAVELWSIASGAPVSTLPSLSIPRDIAFSPDGNMIVIGGFDGSVKVWKHNAIELQSTTPSKDIVRVAYIYREGRVPAQDITQKLDKTIREVQDFYADEMERHGFGRKTFTFETNDNGMAKIYLAKFNQGIELSNDIWLQFKEWRSLPLSIPKLHHLDHIHSFEYTNKDGRSTKGNVVAGQIEGIAPGRSVSINARNLDRKSIAYILRGTFGLPYMDDTKKPNFINRLFTGVNDKMPWGKRWAKLSKCEAEVLDKSRFFNQNLPYFEKFPTIDLFVTIPKASGLRYFIFDVTDEDGIHQVQLFVPRDIKDPRRVNKLQEYQTHNGNVKEIVVFEVNNPDIKNVRLRLIDMLGNIASREFQIKEKTQEQ